MIVWARFNLEERLMDPRNKLAVRMQYWLEESKSLEALLTVITDVVEAAWSAISWEWHHFLLYFSLSRLLFLAFEEDGQKTNTGMCHEWNESTCWAGACWFQKEGQRGDPEGLVPLCSYSDLIWKCFQSLFAESSLSPVLTKASLVADGAASASFPCPYWSSSSRWGVLFGRYYVRSQTT